MYHIKIKMDDLVLLSKPVNQMLLSFRKKSKINCIFHAFCNQEIPLKITIKELLETPETGEVVDCILEVDGKQTINFKFGLNADTPQDITNSLVSFLVVLL